MEREDVEEDVLHHHHPCSSSSSTDSNSNYNNHGCFGNLQHRNIFDYSRSSSMASSSCTSSSSSSFLSSKDNLSTDLRLGLSISSIHDLPSSPRGQYREWPAIKAEMRNTVGEKWNSRQKDKKSLFVKVYMDGLPIGRKLNLLQHHGYHSLLSTLSHMFNTTILFEDVICNTSSSEENHILTYEDKEGDWMMVGDVPWELFLNTVTRLKITSLDKGQ